MFPDLCWNIVLQQNPLAAFSQPRKFDSQFSYILLWIPSSEEEWKRGSTTTFSPGKKDDNILLKVSQHLCAQCQPQNESEKARKQLWVLKIIIIVFFFKSLTIHELMKELFYYPCQFSTLKTKLTGKSRVMQTLNIFFLLQVQNTVG